uniref:Uncharacterized protein n=1 Tax=Ananas comosus var. bracteatus TaxID=296719 RepID=A0A6V7PP98_ANACO|nr:unnamed protein product [Ananas comosus var. bracteatus]
MTKDRPLADVRRGLHDHAFRVMGLRGGSDLGNLISSDSSRGLRSALSMRDRTSLDIVSSERAGVLPADLLVLGQLQDFDIVLGKDWLARYYMIIDCGARTVTFRERGQEEFTYRG